MEEVTLPNEVWLKIFKSIRRQSLMKLRLVCHQFYDVIEYLLNKSPEWKRLTHQTILDESPMMTMQRAYPHVLVTHWWDIDDPVLWRGTYLSYKKWQKVSVNPHTKDTIIPKSNLGYISCVSTFDKYIAIAFNSGLIANYTIDNISQPFYLADHGTRVKQVEFWYSNGELLVVSVGEDFALKFWDVQNKIEIATDGFFANSISSGECRHFCIGDMGGIITSYERVGKHISPGPTLDLELFDNVRLIAHVVDGNYRNPNMRCQTHVWVEGFTAHLLYEGVIEDGKLIEFEITQNRENCMRLPKNLSTSVKFLYCKSFFFAIGLNSIGSTYCHEYIWREYKLGQHFGCNVTSIALHAHNLIFGLEDGSIHLLHISTDYDYDHVVELEKRIKDSKKIEVDTEPIIDVTILEVDKKPCIVAVTKHKVHLINFF